MDDKIPPTQVSQETAEPTAQSSADQKQATSTPNLHEPALSVTTSITSGTTKKSLPKRATSATNSPLPSREPSPVRPPLKQSASSTRSSGPGRSRKNSAQEVSPSRANSTTTTTNPPSAAATPRALSVASTPTLQPVISEPAVKAPVPQKTSLHPEIKETPRWPISPRLRSPPPINKTANIQPRKLDPEAPTINAPRTVSGSEVPDAKQAATDTEDDHLSIPAGMRTPARGASGSTLETVQEISLPNTPGQSLDGFLERVHRVAEPEAIDNAYNKSLKSKGNAAANESGSESGGKGEMKMRAPSAPPATGSRPANGNTMKSYSSTSGLGKGKTTGDGTVRSMTVETETVSSIPQVAVGVVGGGNNGSIRNKPSSETIRPKKEKKKTARKAPSVTSGTGEQPHLSRSKTPHYHHNHIREDFDIVMYSRSPERILGQGPFAPSSSSSATSPERLLNLAARRPSLTIHSVGSLLTGGRIASSKADIFEAKVASAVDEANSSDSEETFVYESNPPDSNDRPRRFHSRTPSVTSMASQVDQRNGSRMDGGHSVAMKKSMKFANSYNSNQPEAATTEDDGKGTARSNVGTGRGTTHHHHIGRWGRNGGNGHPSLFDNESPFPNAAKVKMAGNGSGPRHSSSQPTSPRMAQRLALNGKRSSPISSGYDMDDGADDERTPLISTLRSSRSGRTRRPGATSMRQLEHQAARHNRSFLARFAGCLLLSLMIILVISGATGFLFATSQPLSEVKVLALKNVLASEQEVILDMKVTARNRNLVAVTVDTADMVVFAKSKYAGTDSEWWQKPSETVLRQRGIMRKRDDDPEDPPLGDDPTTNPNLEIGQVYELKSPLTFEGSPFHHTQSISMGQVRITHPGNKTVPSGSERWGRVVQHEFELLIRGTLKYTLPLSQRIRSVSVEGRVMVKPNAADQDPDNVHIIPDLSS